MTGAEHLTVLVTVYGGFAIAFYLLLIATIFNKDRILRGACIFGAACAVILNGGCLYALAGIGTATSGDRSGEEAVAKMTIISFIVVLIWSVLLVIFRAGKKGP